MSRDALCEHFCFFHLQRVKGHAGREQPSHPGTGAAFAPRCDASAWNDIGITVCDCLTCPYPISDGASFLLHLSRLPRCSHTHGRALRLRIHRCACIIAFATSLPACA